MDFFGEEYISEYAWAEFDRLRKERIYQNYIASAVEIVAWNTSRQEESRYMTISLSDLLEPKEIHIEDEMTVEEIKKKQKKALEKLFGGGKK